MLTLNFDPFPVLKTERLLLRRLTDADTQAMFAIRSNPEIMKYVPRPIAQSPQDALDHITMINEKIDRNEGINWAITIIGKPEMIGVIGHYRIKPENYRAEIGYMIVPGNHGKGFVTEAIAATVAYGFDSMKLNSIEALIDPANAASARVLEKNNFVKEAHLRENEFFEDRFLDTVIYSLLASDYRTVLK